ncbi:MAG: M43 family zinc metalloprotease [Bacteroidia bacterium]
MKTNTYKFAILSAIFCTSLLNKGVAQEKQCGTTEATQALYSAHPELIQKEIDYNNMITQEVNSKKMSKSPEAVYIIPIVFHVIHTNGAENISDAQIQDEVAILNRDYRKLNADTSLIVAGFDTLAADIKIEFRLAQIDPNGNCTNGIDRIYSHKTNNADDKSKLNQWPRDKYLNVWTVKTIGSAGVAGYAYYPSAVDGAGYPIDGVLILSNYIGSIGTSSPTTSRALTHEIGHWLNLEHPWGNNNAPGVACGDDLVDDTPITKGHTTCNLTDATCTPGVVENVQNYMDYSYCSVMFTLGQKARMRAALTNAVSGRSNLYINSNLAATGTDGSLHVCVPKPDFYTSLNKNMICPGGSITFNANFSNATPTSVKWTFPGGSPGTSTNNIQSVTYNTPGVYDVKLWGQNSSGQDSLVKTGYIIVSDAYAMVSSGASTENFDNTSLFFSRWHTEDLDNNSRTWYLSTSTGYSGSQSVYMNAYYDYPFDVDNLYSPSYDLSFISSPTLTFRCAAATKATAASDINDVLKVYVSKDCGATWVTCSGPTLSGASFINNGYHPEEFVPSNPSQWALITRTFPSSYATNNTRFKFEYTTGNESNDIYIDDVNIQGTLGVDNNSIDETSVTLFPNPANQSATLSYHLNTKANTKIELIDVLGKKIMEMDNKNQTEGDYTIQLSKQDLNLYNGIYFVKISVDNNTITKKLIIAE